jgi:hypothetical protein
VSAGRTTWYARDAAYLRRELIVELGEEHGPGGVTVMDVLCEWAQQQGGPDGTGEIRGGWRSLSREAFVSVDQAKAIVEHAGEIGAVDDLAVDADGRRFSGRVSGWQADQHRGRAAFRKRRSRAEADDRRADEAPDDPPAESPPGGTSHSPAGQVTPGVTESRSVTESSLPDQTRTTPPKAPEGARQRDRRQYERDLRAFVVTVYNDDTPDLIAAVDQAIRAGEDTAEKITAFLRRWWPTVAPAEEPSEERVA